MFTEKVEVEVIKIDKLQGKDCAPKLILGEKKTIKNIFIDSGGNQHLDVDLKTSLNFVTSFETGEELPKDKKDGKIIHWCHPSRFKKI